MAHGHDRFGKGMEGVRKKNRFHMELFNFIRLRRMEEKRVKDLAAALEPPPQEKTEEIGDKVATIRNRLNGKKRHSKERWNRFAGTSGGGGRGL